MLETEISVGEIRTKWPMDQSNQRIFDTVEDVNHHILDAKNGCTVTSALAILLVQPEAGPL